MLNIHPVLKRTMRLLLQTHFGKRTRPRPFSKVSKNSLLHVPYFADIIASQHHLAADVLRKAGRL